MLRSYYEAATELGVYSGSSPGVDARRAGAPKRGTMLRELRLLRLLRSTPEHGQRFLMRLLREGGGMAAEVLREDDKHLMAVTW